MSNSFNRLWDNPILPVWLAFLQEHPVQNVKEFAKAVRHLRSDRASAVFHLRDVVLSDIKSLGKLGLRQAFPCPQPCKLCCQPYPSSLLADGAFFWHSCKFRRGIDLYL